MKKLAAVLALAAGCSPDTSAPPTPATAPKTEQAEPAPPPRPAVALIQFDAPKEWIKEEPANKLRKAQYRVPDKAKEHKDAELVIFYFGAGSGRIEDNIQRWSGQMGGGDPETQKLEGQCKITLCDFRGTYSSDNGTEPVENARMLAAVVEASDGPWYFKLVGHEATVGGWHDEFVAALKAARK
jgi:hypothetical protein